MGNFRDLGRLATDVDIKYVGDKNTALASFTLVVNRAFKGKDGTDADFHRVQAWGAKGEAISKYFKKGDRIFLEGDLQNNNYEKDGVKHFGYLINLTDFKFVETKKDRENQSEDDFVPSPPPAQATMDDDFVKVDENVKGDIPFFND